ncbi:MAG: serine/threonine-protein kinase [Phycisphaerales bacterium]
MPIADPERWRRLQEHFRALVDAPEAVRHGRMRELAQEDPELAAELATLLEADADAQSASTLTRRLDGAVAQLASQMREDLQLPAWIGDYRIEGVLGTGGMGVVYLAQQESPRRTVALKVIRAFGGANAVRRFQREAELHGRLQHPGIALIYEAGMASERTAEGAPMGPPRPFFAMEHVRGVPLTTWTRERAPGVNERVEVVARVCDAVEHAHSRGVIHRDLKAANVLVDETGQPKVLDFGIARAVQRDQATTLQTAVGEVVGTLPYMSPEQVSGDPLAVGVRSDVYALGVLLFEALTGQKPLDLSGRSLPEAVRIVADEEPTRLGTLDRTLRGDLETIVARCLEKDPQRRYASAGALGEDLRRHLAHLPIEARPPSTAYQVAKFARRNRGLVIGVCTAFVALLAATAVSITMAVRAEKARAEAETQLHSARVQAARSTHSFSFLRTLLTAADPRRSSGKELTAHDLVVQAAKNLESDPNQDNQVTGMLAGLVGYTFYRLGDLPEAERVMRRGVELLRKPDENAVGVSTTLADALTQLGDVLRVRGKLDEAAQCMEEAIQIRIADLQQAFRALGREVAPDDIADGNIAVALNNLALVHQERGDYRDSERAAQRACDMEEHLIEAGQRRQSSYATAMVNLAAAKLLQGHPAEAEPLIRAAIPLRVAAEGEDAPMVQTYRNNLSTTLRSLGRYRESKELLEQVREVRRRTLPPGHFEWASSELTYAQTLAVLGDIAGAEAPVRATVEAYTKAFGADHNDTARARQVWAGILDALGRTEEAAPEAERARNALAKTVGERNLRVADADATCATVARHQGDRARARACAERAISVAQERGDPAHPTILRASQEIAQCLLDAGTPQDRAEGERMLGELAQLVASRLGEGHPVRARLLLLRAESALVDGRPQRAVEDTAAALAILKEGENCLAWVPAYAAALHGRAVAAAGGAADSAQARARALAAAATALGERSHDLVRMRAALGEAAAPAASAHSASTTAASP